jgi:hypothetical protein
MDCIVYLESKEFVTIVRPKPKGVDYYLIHITSKGVNEIENSTVPVRQRYESGSQPIAEKSSSKLKQDIQISISYAKEDSEKALKLYNDLNN